MRRVSAIVAFAIVATATAAQSPVDLATISRIKQEALTRSEVWITPGG